MCVCMCVCVYARVCSMYVIMHIFTPRHKEPHYHMYTHVCIICIYETHKNYQLKLASPCPPPQPATNHGHRCGGLASACGTSLR